MYWWMGTHHQGKLALCCVCVLREGLRGAAAATQTLGRGWLRRPKQAPRGRLHQKASNGADAEMHCRHKKRVAQVGNMWWWCSADIAVNTYNQPVIISLFESVVYSVSIETWAPIVTTNTAKS